MKLLFEIIRARKKSFILILVLLTGNALIYFYASSFQQNKIETLQNSLLETKRQNTGSKTSMAFAFSQGMKDLAVFRSLIPPKKEFIRVVGELNETATNNNLRIENIGYKPEMLKEGGLLIYTLSFNVSGSYAAIKSFISDIGKFRELLFIDQLGLNSTGVNQESVNLKIQLSAYFKTEGQ
jgi:type IV pilus assembly protein PilO